MRFNFAQVMTNPGIADDTISSVRFCELNVL